MELLGPASLESTLIRGSLEETNVSLKYQGNLKLSMTTHLPCYGQPMDQFPLSILLVVLQAEAQVVIEDPVLQLLPVHLVAVSQAVTVFSTAALNFLGVTQVMT